MKKKFIMLILSVCVIPPFANDIYIASFPEISQIFQTSQTSLIMTVFMIGLAVSQLFYGPLLDRFGRKPILTIGLIIYTLASLMLVFSHSFHLMLVGRFFQAIGACSTIVTVMAIARDVYKNEQLINTMAMIMGIIGICPAIAPLLGSFLQELFGWHGAFSFLLILGICYLFIISFLFKETIQEKNMNAIIPRKLYQNYRSLLKIKVFQGYILTSACSYGILFSYAAASSILIIGYFHYSITTFGIVFSLNSLAIVIMSILTPRLNKHFSISTLVLIGASLTVIGALITIIINLIFNSNIYTRLMTFLKILLLYELRHN